MNYYPTSPSASPASSTSSSPSSPISIGWPSPSPSGSLSACSTRSGSSTSQHAHCAFPSWSFFNSSAPSSYISDADLFPDSLLDSAPLMEEAPAPPRIYAQVPAVTAAPLLPLYASDKPKKRRRSSGKKRHPSKPMTPIAESPLAAPE